MEIINQWIDLATRPRTVASRLSASEFDASRLSALRGGDLHKWSRMSRLSTPLTARYAPQFYTTTDGTQARPNSPQEALLGTEQEWGKLLRGPSLGWNHPAVKLWTDSAGWSRGTVSTEQLTRQSPASLEGRVLHAFIGPPSQLRYVPWSGLQIQIWDGRYVAVGNIVLTHDASGNWWAVRPAPCTGLPQPVVLIDGVPPCSWCLDRWCLARTLVRLVDIFIGSCHRHPFATSGIYLFQYTADVRVSRWVLALGPRVGGSRLGLSAGIEVIGLCTLGLAWDAPIPTRLDIPPLTIE